MRHVLLGVIVILGILLFVSAVYPVPTGAPYREVPAFTDEGHPLNIVIGTPDYSQLPAVIKGFKLYGMIPFVIECFLIWAYIMRREQYPTNRTTQDTSA